MVNVQCSDDVLEIEFSIILNLNNSAKFVYVSNYFYFPDWFDRIQMGIYFAIALY